MSTTQPLINIASKQVAHRVGIDESKAMGIVITSLGTSGVNMNDIPAVSKHLQQVFGVANFTVSDGSAVHFNEADDVAGLRGLDFREPNVSVRIDQLAKRQVEQKLQPDYESAVGDIIYEMELMNGGYK